MSEAKVEKIKDAANRIMGSSCATGVEVQDKRKRVFTISTGSRAVDQIMAGGVWSQGVGVEPNMALENILYARAFNSDIKWSSLTSARSVLLRIKTPDYSSSTAL
ncbi:RecA family ATPase [Mycena kentingensis (nom. inval.)]|nr:RecA family ATPase [Mycena kentingensis (nom. inval.)]